jgi:hypothetical protein
MKEKGADGTQDADGGGIGREGLQRFTGPGRSRSGGRSRSCRARQRRLARDAGDVLPALALEKGAALSFERQFIPQDV